MCKIIVNHLHSFVLETFVSHLLYFNIGGSAAMIWTGKCLFGQVNLTDLSVRMTGVLKALSTALISLECDREGAFHWSVIEKKHSIGV